MLSCCNNGSIAKVFEFSEIPEPKKNKKDPLLINQILLVWCMSIEEKPEPKRILAEMILKLGSETHASEEDKKIINSIAKELDLYLVT